MSSTALLLELPPEKTPGIWPWLVGLVALILLGLTFTNQISTIPESLLSLAQQRVTAAGIDGVNVSIDGRDLTLNGTVIQGVDRDTLASQLASITGIRVVRDELVEFDPKAQARIDKQTFQDKLGQLDFSAVAFDPGLTTLADGSEQPLLRLAALLKSYPDFRVRVAGHTDNTGRASVNLRISGERAQAVSSFLASQGINTDQMIAKGYGATQPIADNDTELGRANNRRIEISYVD